jgi:hypothetical protein
MSMERADRLPERLAIALACASCAATLAGCPLMSDGEKSPGHSGLDIDSGEGFCTDGVNLYLTQSAPAPQGLVKAVDLSGPSATTVAEGLDHPTCIVTDGQHLFWLENTTPGGRVLRSGLDGSDPVALASGLDLPHAIAIDGTYVFFADTRGGVTAISRVPKAGGEPTLLLSLPAEFDTTLAADDAWVYYTAPYDRPGGYIGRIPVEGGDSQTVITGLGTPTALLLSGSTLCFTEFMGGNVSCVQDVNAGWNPTTLATGEYVNFGTCPGRLLLDNGTVYFAIHASATTGAIRMVVPGYAPVTLATTDAFGTVMGMVLLGSQIYWLEDDAIYRIDKGF